MSETRDSIIQTLFRKPNATINELAKEVRINAISVRHHLINLQADKLVESEEQRHGVGRPRLVYRLTEAGRERFPSRYLSLTTRILKELKEKLPKDTVRNMFNQFGRAIAPDYTPYRSAESLEKKMRLLLETIGGEGFELEWEDKDGTLHIVQSACPLFYIGKDNPEICEIDSAFIKEIFETDVEQTACLLRGDNHCVYEVKYKR